MNKNIVILLTACINPQGMAYTAIQDSNVRLEQYKKALQWYLENIKYPILFVENTNYDITPIFQQYVDSGRLEVLTFDGNNYDKSLGKGYGEALIVEYAVNNSKMLQSDCMVAKVTGRLITHGISRILNSVKAEPNNVYADWIEYRPQRTFFADSRLFVFPVGFMKDYFLTNKEKLNDSKEYFFEHLLRDSIMQWKADGKHFNELSFDPQFEGVGGSLGDMYRPSLKKDVSHFLRKYVFHPLGYYGPLNPLKKTEK